MDAATRIRVWDPAVRLFHWSVAGLFFLGYATGDEDSALHVYAGYSILTLVAARIVWGFIGTRHARFSDFVVGPAATLRYAKSLLSGSPQHYVGHNPLGGWMILALFAALLATSWTGLKAYAVEGKGPLAGPQPALVAHAMAKERHESGQRKTKRSGNKFWEEAHEVLAGVTMALVLLHIAGVLVGSALHRENLIKAMITGYKQLPSTSN